MPLPMELVLHSYSLRGYSREHLFAVVREAGWSRVELAACHLDAGQPDAGQPDAGQPDAGQPDAGVRGDLAVAVAQAGQAGASIHCVGYWGLFADGDQARRATIERTRAVIDACAEHGIGLVNGSGGWLVHDPVRWDADWRANGTAIATAADLRRVAEAYRELADHAADRGVRINIEIHPNTVHDTAAATARLLDLIDRDTVGVTVDPSNAAAISAPDRDPEVLSQLGDRVTYLHVKNCTVRDGVADFSTDADRGVIDNDRWLAAAAETGRCPAVSLEYCGDGDPHPRLAASRRYVEGVLQRIAAQRALRPIATAAR